MTIERSPLRRALSFAVGAAAVLGAWTAILAGLALTLPPGVPLAVFAPGHAMETVAAARGSFEGFGRSIAITRSADPGLMRRLYGAGASRHVVPVPLRANFSLNGQAGTSAGA